MDNNTRTINNKRIAKNTLFLYIRMFITLFVGLFTSRVVLDVLGSTDYGIYNIIGGVVVLFSFLNNALISATQRFLNFNIGRNDLNAVSKVFCMSMNSYIILSLIFFVLAETIGLWFVDTQLNIPADRMEAANWVYQFSIITFIINLIRIPYNASIIAYERMDFYAYVSLFEIIMKLGVVYLLYIATIDKLILYSFLYAMIPFLTNIIYKIYCNRNFATTRFKKMWDKETFKNLFGFSGWSLFGSLANMSAQQGINILINIFYGVTVNAAVGIANQVSTQVFQFISNFQIAFQPQIVKTYASEQTDEFHNLIFKTSKFSFFMMFILAFPFILTADTIMSIWLVDVPQYTVLFSQLILGFLIIECVTAPLWMAVQATGKIKRYQIWMAACIFLNFPLTYTVFKLGLPVYSAWIIRIIVNLITCFFRCVYMKKYMGFPIEMFFPKVLYPIARVTIISIPIPIAVLYIMQANIISFCVLIPLTFVISGITIYKIGLSGTERALVLNVVNKKILKRQ